jgi:hypothetical protein
VAVVEHLAAAVLVVLERQLVYLSHQERFTP